MFPRIQRPCPFKDNLSEVMNGDVCRVCTRKVYDLNAMSAAERATFLASCSGEVCVSYSLRPAILAAASVVALAMPAAAQDPNLSEEVIMVGGIDAARIEYVADPNAVSAPDMPIVYEDEAPVEPTEAKPQLPRARTSAMASSRSRLASCPAAAMARGSPSPMVSAMCALSNSRSARSKLRHRPST